MASFAIVARGFLESRTWPNWRSLTENENKKRTDSGTIPGISRRKLPEVDVSCPDCAFAGVVLCKGLA
jgi:hypothetical protein